MRAYVIGNPRAGRGRHDWDGLVSALRSRKLDVTLKLTEAPGAATSLAAEARSEGVDLVVAAGGDGTVHEVVNGLLASDAGDGPLLGVVPVGSGCDYARTFGLTRDPEEAARRLASETPAVRVDAGEVVYAGGRERRFFANIAEVGIGAETTERAARLPRRLGPAVYGVAFALTLPGSRRGRARIQMDGQTYEGPMVNLVVAVARVFGGGMNIAPQADPADGLFDVQVHFGSKVDYVRGLPKVYKGKHIPHPRIKESRAAEVSVRSEPERRIEADGEVLGHSPATFRILPGALRLKV